MINYLHEHTATLQLNETTLTVDVLSGCPQGSLLSQLLWNIVVDEALNLRLPPGVRIQEYADDFVITKTGQDNETIKRDLQCACSILTQCGQSVKLEFASSKSELIVFTKKRNKPNITININGLENHPSKTAKYLGVILD